MITKKSIFVGLVLIILLNLNTIETTANEIYVLDLNYDKGNINLIDVSVKQGYAPDRRIQPEDGYRCDVVSFSNTVLYSFKFEIPRILMTPPPLPGEEPRGPIYLDNVNFTLLIPYFENGKSINIYDPSNFLVLSVDVSQFAKLCGNGICDYGENYKNCPQDCPSGGDDGYCDGLKDGICDPNCKADEDKDCIKEEKDFSYIFYMLGILILFGTIFLIYKIKKAQKIKEENRLIEWIKKKLKEGEDPEVLRRILREEGHNENLVDKAEEKS